MCARAEAGPVGPKRGLAAVPTRVGGAWQGFEATSRAKLAARTAEAGGQARGGRRSVGQQTTSRKTAAHAHTKQPGPPDSTRDARNTRGAATPHSSPAAQHAA